MWILESFWIVLHVSLGEWVPFLLWSALHWHFLGTPPILSPHLAPRNLLILPKPFLLHILLQLTYFRLHLLSFLHHLHSFLLLIYIFHISLCLFVLIDFHSSNFPIQFYLSHHHSPHLPHHATAQSIGSSCYLRIHEQDRRHVHAIIVNYTCCQ